MRKSVQTVFGIVESCGITQHVGGTNMSKNSRIIDMFCCCETRDFLVYFRCWPAIMLSKRVNSMNNIQNYNPNVSPAPQYIPYPPPVDLRFMTEQIEAWAYEAGKTQATLKFRENQLEAVSGLVKQYGASYIISSRGTPIQVFADQLSTAEYLCFHALFERENMICLTFRSGRTFTVSESVFASDKKLAQAFATTGLPITGGHRNFREIMAVVRAEIKSVSCQKNIHFYLGWISDREEEN